ncbi:hypothetical protein WHR41_00607 [Cladosporium halotolerans]|uniref:S-adenosyl-L-methionine-dependent methyltransferase n=1 Tax=Cladosporium halotolerans TaxID=1052096 RepID=A0AB34L3A2_9PEZI
MSLPTKLDTYPLARGVIDSVRLNVCHFIWKKYFPWVVHPSVKLDGRPNLRIADVGCGTGIWLLEAAEEYPNADGLDGLDIALHQAPPKHLLPRNVQFKHLDLHQEIPAEFVGQYDLVHARFLLGLVRNNDPVPLLQNLLKLLKPGGYLQWNEVDWASDLYIGLEENGITQEESGLHKMRAWGKPFLGEVTWPKKMEEIVKAQGLEDVQLARKTKNDLPRQYSMFWTEALVAAGIDMTGKLPEGPMRDQAAQLVEEASLDAKKGIAWAGDHMVVVGRKPL